MVNADQLKEATPVPSTNSHFDFEVRYNFEADPPIVAFKLPLSELQDLMLHKHGAITISHQEFVETLHALSVDPKAPIHDRGVAIDLLKRSI
ncbi:MAG: hypothetical protein WCC97_08440 [Candidatus Acidiferrales bacterium]